MKWKLTRLQYFVECRPAAAIFRALPDPTFHNLRVAKNVHWRILCKTETLMYGFCDSILVKGSVGCWQIGCIIWFTCSTSGNNNISFFFLFFFFNEIWSCARECCSSFAWFMVCAADRSSSNNNISALFLFFLSQNSPLLLTCLFHEKRELTQR